MVIADMSEQENGYGSKARSIRLALMLAALALTFFFGSFFFLTR
jgi:hypothetical protein